jgi:hypothetical protein
MEVVYENEEPVCPVNEREIRFSFSQYSHELRKAKQIKVTMLRRYESLVS